MAEGGEHPSINTSVVTDELLATIADKLVPQHLQEFATTLIRLDVAEYNDIVKEAREDEGKQSIEVSWFFFILICIFFLYFSQSWS